MQTSTDIRSSNKLDDNINICTPRQVDILCGQDKVCLNHEGSPCFRMIIDLHRQEYKKCETKLQKMEMIKEIFENIQKLGSRFLRYNRKTKSWLQINEVVAREKNGHALRFANQQQRRRQFKSKTQSKTQISERISLSFLCEKKSPEKLSPVYDTNKGTNFKAPIMTPVSSPSSALPSLETEFRQISKMNHNFYDPIPLTTQEYNESKELLEPDLLPSNSINEWKELLQPDLLTLSNSIHNEANTNNETNFEAPMITLVSSSSSSELPPVQTDKFSQTEVRPNSKVNHHAYGPLPLTTQKYNEWKELDHLGDSLLDVSLTNMRTNAEFQEGMMMGSSISHPTLYSEQNRHRQQREIFTSVFLSYQIDELSELPLQVLLRDCQSVSNDLPIAPLDYEW